MTIEWIFDENWLEIIGYQNLYEVSDLGRIRSIETKVRNGYGFRVRPSIILKPFRNNDKYLVVNLSKNNKLKPHRVARLVAYHFIPNHLSLPEVNHKFGDKEDNRANSLEWSSVSHNRKHAWNTGLNKGNTKNFQ